MYSGLGLLVFSVLAFPGNRINMHCAGCGAREMTHACMQQCMRRFPRDARWMWEDLQTFWKRTWTPLIRCYDCLFAQTFIDLKILCFESQEVELSAVIKRTMSPHQKDFLWLYNLLICGLLCLCALIYHHHQHPHHHHPHHHLLNSNVAHSEVHVHLPASALTR
jgi:hypothetical protein